MRAFWWYETKAIAGMARPGFNQAHWLDLPFDEGVLMGWLGQYSSGSAPLTSFREHLQDYALKVAEFRKINEPTAKKMLSVFDDSKGLIGVLKRMSDRMQLLKSFEVKNDQIDFEFNPIRLNEEIKFLKQQGLRKIVSLTELHHGKATLEKHFDLYHLPINDLEAPRKEQVYQLAEVIKSIQKNNDGLAVHCLAGIGRTSTMLMAAHMILGDGLENLKSKIAIKNPAYSLTGPQSEFIHSLWNNLPPN